MQFPTMKVSVHRTTSKFKERASQAWEAGSIPVSRSLPVNTGNASIIRRSRKSEGFLNLSVQNKSKCKICRKIASHLAKMPQNCRTKT